jgi:hypothetical protein
VAGIWRKDFENSDLSLLDIQWTVHVVVSWRVHGVNPLTRVSSMFKFYPVVYVLEGELKGLTMLQEVTDGRQDL